MIHVHSFRSTVATVRVCAAALLTLVCLVAFDQAVDAAGPAITSLAFSPDGQRLVATSQSGLSVYQWPSLKRQKLIAVSSPHLHDLAFSPQGTVLAVAGGTPADDGTVQLFSWPQFASLRTLTGHSDSVMSVAWLDNQSIVAASLDHELTKHNVAFGKTPRRINGHSRGVRAVVTLQTNQQRTSQILSAGIDHSLRLWKASDGSLVHSLSIHTAPVVQLAIRPGQHTLPMVASASEDRTVRFWQPTIGRMVRFVRLPAVPLAIAWIDDGSKVAATCTDGHLRVIDAQTAEVTNDLPLHDDWLPSIAVHADGKTIVVGDVDGKVHRITTAKLLSK